MEPGDMRVLVVAGLGTSILSGGGAGLELRFERQVATWATVGGGAGLGYDWEANETSRGKGKPELIYGFRGWGRFNPAAVEWVALTAATGISGTNQGTVALTFDGSALVGGVIDLNKARPGEAFRISPYGGPAGAISIPLRQGTPIQRSKYFLGFGPDMRTQPLPEEVAFETTYFFGFQAGAAADSGVRPAWTGALEFLFLGARAGKESASILAISTGQGARFRKK